ncbi:hypothetical protein [Natronorubrum tibetense]|uniref:DNA recombination and repair protein Rad51-like C-terminal domain-containing protein n=1 Tax=Natronorubrum tibetense GA33 TaxID=1114856 RepID=L9W068_9EURY|nr:hypothetical protein [Natronorubrum tibetense]ELY42850.1 hypothetical protein C496_05937 [Natronorubrum tibetense GA33]
MHTHSPVFGLEFEPGLTLLEVPSPRSTIPHRLVGARLTEPAAESDSETNPMAYWIDARNTAATQVLYDCVPNDRALEPLRIARAFTAYQHHSLIRRVTRRVGPETELIVAPNVASLYHDADLPDWEREDLLAASLETLAELGRVLSCPVVVTSADDGRAATVAEYAAATIECVRTREGIRLERSDEEPTDDGETGAAIDETAGYWHGTHWQTTIPYWVDLYGSASAVQSVVEAHDRGLLEVTL